MSFYFLVWGLEFQCFREGNRVPKLRFLEFLGFKGGGGGGGGGGFWVWWFFFLFFFFIK
jgi:hypothetical protein